MAPNPNVAKAFSAMENLGISAVVVKPVLKDLLKLYEKNWDFIEAENYRALLDAIFEKQDTQVAPPEKKNLDLESQVAVTKKKRRNEDLQVAETKKKRRNEDLQVAETKKKLQNADQEEKNEEAEANGEPDRPLKRLRLRYQDNHVSSSSGCPSPGMGVNSKHLQLQTVNNSQVLLKPKDEPESLPFHSENVEKKSDGALDSSSERRTNCELANIVGESSSKLELASTHSGEVKIYMSCIPQGRPDFHIPSLNELLRRTEDKCLQSHKFLDPSCSVRQILNELCQCALEIGTSSFKESQEEINVAPADDSSRKFTLVDAEAGTEEPLTPKVSGCTQEAAQVEEPGILCLPSTSNGIGHGTLSVDLAGMNCLVGRDNEQNGVENVTSHNRMVVEHLELTPLQTSSSIFLVDDISKGLESVIISVSNEVNNELPPAFRYMPSNVKFENANVRFSLARVGDSFCSTCIGDCVSNPCACAHVTGGVVYTVEGLIKKDFLEECISMNHDSRKQSLFYCKDCPLERSKVEDAKEGCKGHLVRKFIKECWWKCGCNAKCGNRVVQHGIRRNLQVFMTSKGKGWGLRTQEDLPKGTFVCEFVGEILTNTELYARVSKTSNTEKYEFPVFLDAGWSARDMKDEDALCLDAVYYGNVARFINHRCFDANLVGIPLEVDTPEHHYYRFALFTTRKVDALEELTRDYGIDFDDHGNQFKTFECLCESKFCRNLRRKTRSRSAKRRR